MKKKIFPNDSALTNALFAVLMALLVAAVVLLNVLARGLSERYPLSADLTANAAYRIGDDTKAVLSDLSVDVDLYVLASEGSFSNNSYLTQLRHILEEYPRHSGHIRLSYVDVSADPTFAASYPDLELKEADVLVVSTFGIRQLPLANMFIYTYDAAGSLTVTACRGEEAVTSAIAGVQSADTVKVGFLSGNGVTEDVSAFKTVLADNNFDVSDVNMVRDSFDDYDILLLLAPTVDLSEDVLKKLDAFLYRDGQLGRTLLYAADVSQPQLPNLDSFLREWGAAVGDGAVFETSADRAYSYQPYYPYTDYTDTEYSALLKDSSNPFLAPLSRPLRTVYGYRDNRTVSTLLSFGKSAGVRPSDAPDSFTAARAEEWGPFPALVLSEWQTGKAAVSSRLIVSSSAAAFGSAAMGNTSLSNAEYTVNLFNKFTDRENTIAIAPKSLAGNTLTLSTAAASRLGVLLCIVLPLLILGTGVAVFLRRRYK